MLEKLNWQKVVTAMGLVLMTIGSLWDNNMTTVIGALISLFGILFLAIWRKY